MVDRGWGMAGRRAVANALLGALSLLLLATAGWAGAPTDQLKSSTEQIIRILDDPALKAEARMAERRAAIRKEADVAFGNIIGSNIYNILGIGGMTALIVPGRVPIEIVRFDNLVMVGTSLLVVVLGYTGWRIGRREGALLLAGYIGYVVWLWPR